MRATLELRAWPLLLSSPSPAPVVECSSPFPAPYMACPHFPALHGMSYTACPTRHVLHGMSYTAFPALVLSSPTQHDAILCMAQEAYKAMKIWVYWDAVRQFMVDELHMHYDMQVAVERATRGAHSTRHTSGSRGSMHAYMCMWHLQHEARATCIHAWMRPLPATACMHACMCGTTHDAGA